MRWGSDDFSDWEKKRFRRWRRQRILSQLKRLALPVAFLAAFAAAWKYLPQSMDLRYTDSRIDNHQDLPEQWDLPKQWDQPKQRTLDRHVRERSVYYRNCAAAWRDGAAPIYEGEPGYRPELDGDGDGIACEPMRYRTRSRGFDLPHATLRQHRNLLNYH